MTPRSLGIATDLDVLPVDRVILRRRGYAVVRTPSNPRHYWGNFLVYDAPPGDGDGERWEAAFDRELGGDDRIRHRAFTWDRAGAAGRAREEFVPRGYELEETVVLVAARDELHAHPRENRDVEVRALDPHGDEELWNQVVELQVADRDGGQAEDDYRAFASARLTDRRAHFVAGRGAWYVALDPADGALAASCGIVVTGGRARYQAVGTAPAFRRRGVASRLVAAAARHAAETFAAQRFVIAADADYHALGLYESLGFRGVERLFGVCRG